MCEVRIVYTGDDEARVDIVGYHNRIETVGSGPIVACKEHALAWHELTTWKITEYQEEIKTIKELKPIK